MVKNIAILGVSGMLGHKMLQILSRKFETVGTLRKHNNSSILDQYSLYEDVDAGNFLTVSKTLDDINPDIIINCIGIVKQLPESNNWDISHAINSEFPHKLCTYSKFNDIQLIHISSDCVFDGKQGMYKESDIPNATDIYGKTKFTGEISDSNCLVLRTSIIGREINTNHGLLEWFLSKKNSVYSTKILGYTKSIFSGVTTNELSNLVSDIIYNGKNLKGLYHVASNPITKFDLLELINKYTGELVTIDPVDGEVINRSLNGSKLKNALGYVPPSWDEMLDEMLIKDITKYKEL